MKGFLFLLLSLILFVDSRFRILTIGANLGTVCDILLDVIPTFEEVRTIFNSADHYNGAVFTRMHAFQYQKFEDLDFDCELRLLIHQSQAGCIIGRAGFKIKELREAC